MSGFPQLRVRTEYSFKRAYGPIKAVVARLSALGAKQAAIVDTDGTWGHVQWEKGLAGSGIEPIFGSEFKIITDSGAKGTYWALARSLPAFYQFSSNPPETEAELCERKEGLVIFAGPSLSNPAAFDYIDINPRSRIDTLRALALADRTGKPMVATSDCDYPGPEDEDKYMAWVDSKKMTPQTLLTEEELRAALWYVSDDRWSECVENTRALAAELAGQKLQRASIIKIDGDLPALVEAGRQYRLARGAIPEWTAAYQTRLEREMKLIEEKSYTSYFLVVADVINWAKERMLVGPGRGSSAGSLVCYLLRITEVDPLVHGLIFERFIDVNRSDLPDIDIDFNDQKRELAFDYMREKYRPENTARIGSVNRLKPRSVIARVGDKLGIPHGAAFSVTNVLIEYSSGDRRFGKGIEDTLANTQPGRDFIAKYPEAILMTELENHASHSGVHAAGFIVANDPVTNYCTVRDGIAHIDKKDAEYLNLLKIDALGLRTLGIIEETGCMTSEQLYDLKLNDPEVFRIFNEKKFSGVFQFEGPAQRRVAVTIPVKSFQQIDHITALSRPGPLGGGAADTYALINCGKQQVVYHHPSMREYLEETHGVVLYQEQVMRISFEIGRMPWEVVSEIRKAMSASKGVEYFNQRGEEFVRGAATLGISREEAEVIWGEIVTFGGWGMNKSHTVSYSVISYWCAYMKRYYPLEYAAACLRNSKSDEQTVEILRELDEEGVTFVPFDAQLSGIDWEAREGRLVGGFKNLHGIGPAKAQHYVQLRESRGLTEKDLAAIAKHPVKHECLRPAHALWGDIYANPDRYNIDGKVKQFSELEDNENAVVICQLVKSNRRDENEHARVNKRGYAMKGQTLFLDAGMVDDSIGTPITVRIKPNMWFSHGEKMADRAIPKKDWFLVRGKWLKLFSIMTVTRIKCLTNPDMFL